MNAVDCKTVAVLSKERAKLKAKWFRFLLPLMLVIWLFVPLTVSAHPLGNFTINQYSRLDVGMAGIKLLYIVDFAEIPTIQEQQIMDKDGNRQFTKSEQDAYAVAKARELKNGLKLTIDDKLVELKLLSQDLAFLAGEGGLATTRFTMRFETSALPRSATRLDYKDENFPNRVGWKEMVVRPANGVALLTSSAPSTDLTNGLRGYPADMLLSPVTVTSAQAVFQVDPSIKVETAPDPDNQQPIAGKKPLDFFTSLFSEQALTLPVILLAFLVAFGLGMLHAFSPGHGKTVVGAYLIGSRSSAKHALFLGATVTITHTIGVFGLGIITLAASQYIVPEQFYPWLSLISGLMVLVLGLALLWNRTRLALAGGQRSEVKTPSQVDHEHHHGHDHHHAHQGHSHDHHHHDHEHHHGHDHHHHHDHEHHHGHDHHHHHDHEQNADHDHHHDHAHDDHAHSHALEAAQAVGVIKQEARLTALSHSDHRHEHNHQHDYYHDHDHDHGHDHNHDHDHDHPHKRDQFLSGLTHSHGGITHSHLPPGADGTKVTWKSLLVFGISAGLLPCPSALVLMLSTIALNMTAFGLVLVVFFSLGLAATLTIIGLLLIYSRHLVSKVRTTFPSPLIRLIPVAAALVIAAIGLLISYDALIQLQTGILNR
jgi:ABC-type nickel/cobalt efflux system permease component RcnA